MKTEAVLLDAGGVLLMPDHEEVCGELSAVGIEVDPSRMEHAHYSGMRAVDVDASRTIWESYNLAYLDRLGVAGRQLEDGMSALARIFPVMEWKVVIEPSRAALPALAGLTQVAVVSNSDGTVERLLRSTGVAQVGAGEGTEVVTVVDSHVVGISKPDPAIFHHALEILGVEASKAVHVGDSVRFDVAGAEAAGVRPLHFDPLRLCTEGGHEHIRGLEEVSALLS